jgi:hypothetical protein
MTFMYLLLENGSIPPTFGAGAGATARPDGSRKRTGSFVGQGFSNSDREWERFPVFPRARVAFLHTSSET